MLFSGSVVAQLFGIVSTPIKTRLFSVEDVGFFTYATTIMSIFTPLLLGQYDAVIVMVKKHVYVAMKVCMCLCIMTSIVFTLGVFVYFMLGGNIYNNIAILVCKPFFLLTSGVINTISAYNNRCREYNLLAKVNIQRSMANFLGILLFGILDTGYAGLLFVAVISQLVAIREQIHSLNGNWGKIISVKYELMWLLVKKYWQQPIFSMPGTFVNGLSYAMIAICVKNMYDFTTLGYYSMSITLLGIPLGLISGNVGKVFLEEASREKNETGFFINSFLKTIKYLVFFTIPIFTIIYIWAPLGCEFFLGRDWYIAGEYIRYLIPMFLVRFVVSPITLSVVISQKQYLNTILQAIFLMAVGGCYYLALKWGFSLGTFLIIINWNFVVIYLLFLYVCWGLAKKRR